MSYTGSKSVTALGATLTIATKLVGEITDLTLSGRTMGSDVVTNFNSTSEEFLPTILVPGNWMVKGNKLPGITDLGQAQFETTFNTVPPALAAFVITLPKATGQVTTGDSWSFNALVESLDYAYAAKKATSYSATLKVSGAITFTSGA